jgi:hypothetical protein
MIRIRRKKQALISLLSLVLLLKACKLNNDNDISGQWEVISIEIKVANEMEYLQESMPGLLDKKFKSQLPQELKDGDQINFIEHMYERKVIFNVKDTFSYYLTDTSLIIRQSDMVYTLGVKLSQEKLVLYRILPHGSIEWRLKRID